MVKQNKLKEENKEASSGNRTAKLLSLLMIVIYALLYFIDYNLFRLAFSSLGKMVVQLLPYLALIFIFMLLTEFLITPEKAKKIFANAKGIKAVSITAVVGILSVGPAYIWFPFLSNLRKHGLTNKLIAIFMYNRAVKLHLFPVMVLYFGIKFTVVFSLMLFLFSFLIGTIVEYFTVEEEEIN